MTSIRTANEKDLDRIEEIYEHIHDEEELGKAVTGWVRNVYPAGETAKSALKRGDLFVLEDGGKIAATAIINRLQVPEYKDAEWKHGAADSEIMVLHTLAVDPFEKGRGYGKAFVAFYESYAKENGCFELRMDTNMINAAARAMYKKLGYEEIGVVSCVFNGIPGVKLVCLEKYLA